MNEIQKTGTFWGIALVVALLATVIAWPTSTDESVGPDSGIIGQPLFAEFKDPLAAASLKIVTFNEQQGELKNFEVRKDPESGLWTIPSKGGYPADAIEQMRDAANALVALDVLDLPTSSPEDHEGMGVVEPKLEDLDPGDEGVGRLVTLKDEEQKVLASVIIGNEVKGQEGQVYVRKPGQDPVYVVKLDDQPLSTKFEDWIEEDLLQMSSIDVEDVVLKDYNASLGIQGVSLTRNYQVELAKDGSEWNLDALKEFDKNNPLAEPKTVEIDPTKKLNSTKLNDLANALDDLKFVDVKRKPDGISANLKADQDFSSDKEAAGQLASRGFIPVPLGPNREIEILSANGELTATTKDGVQYILRFGNISGITEEDDAAEEDANEESAGGVNRYLMVSTVVDESKFPVPDLKRIPQTLEELEALEKPAPPEGVELPAELNAPEAEAGEAEAGEDMKGDAAEESTAEESTAEENTAEENTAEQDSEGDAENGDTPEAKDDGSNEADEAAGEEGTESSAGATEESGVDTGSVDVNGEGEASAVGDGQEKEEEAQEESADGSDEAAASEASSDGETSTEEAVEETEEEKMERLAAVQEKITKENERKREERKEKLEQARIQSKKLNARFADWYYVIPEATYSKLRISRDDLFDTSDGPAGPNPALGPQIPNFQFPGAPGN